MGFTSTDDLVNKISTLGKFFRLDYSKVLSPVGTVIAGKWFDLFGFPGYPCQGYYGNMVLNGDFMASAYPWTFTMTWSYTAASHVMTKGATNDGGILTQNTKCIPGEKYTLIWAKGAGAGSITPSLGGTNLTARTGASTIYREDVICGTGAGAPLTFTTTDGTASVIDVVWLCKSADFYPMTSETEGAMYLGATPGVGETKHLINWAAWNNALLGSPAVLELVDIVGVYPCVKQKVLFKQTLQHSTRLYNGQFIGAATGWTLNGTSWAYAATNTVARTKTADTDTLSQTGLDILAGVPYRLKYTMGSTTSYGGIGTATIAVGGTGFNPGAGNLITVTQAGAASGQLSCTANGGGVLTSIDSVSVAGTGYHLGSALATVGGNNNATVNITVIAGGGTITPILGTVAGIVPRTADGTYTETITPTVTGGSLVFTPTSDKIATLISDVSLIPLFPRYTDGAGLRFYAMTSNADNIPGANASNVLVEYRNQLGWPTYTTVDSCDVTTNWTGSADVTLTVNNTTFTSGVGSLNFRKSGTGAALITMIKDTTSVNMTGKKLTFRYYCVDAAAYAKLAAAGALIVRFGTDSTHYYQWTFANTVLLGQSQTGAGWQQIECSLLNYTSKTANAVDLTAMDYTYIGLTASAAGTVWAAGDFMIDQIEVVPEASFLGATTTIGTLSLVGQIAHSGAAAGNIAPFMPLAAGDTGVQRIESVTINAVSTNEASLCIVVCKPLASIPLPYGFVAAERDFASQLPSFPQIKDGACLGLLMFTGAVTAAGTGYFGNLDIAYG